MITRRDLLQAAGAAGAVVLADKIVSATAPERKGWRQLRGDVAGVPSYTTFRAVAVNHISYNVHDYRASRDFYRAVLGMQVAYDDGKQCALTFGDPPNAIYLRHTNHAAHVDHVAYSVVGFEKDGAQALLRRRGLAPRPDGPDAWTIHDPAGFMIQVCAIEGVFPGAESAWAKQSDGTKNLTKLPAVAPAALHTLAVDIPYRIPNELFVRRKMRDFYVDLLGMHMALEDGDHSDLLFGVAGDGLSLRRGKSGTAPVVDSLTYLVSSGDRDAVGAELARRGLKPQSASRDGWSIADPDGFAIHIVTH